MKWLKIAAVAACANVGVSAGAMAADALDTDVACLTVSFVIAGNEDKSLAEAGQMQAIYFAGKLDGRVSEAELERRIVALAPAINDAWIQQNAVTCGGMLMTKGTELTRLGERLQAIAATMED